MKINVDEIKKENWFKKEMMSFQIKPLIDKIIILFTIITCFLTLFQISNFSTELLTTIRDIFFFLVLIGIAIITYSRYWEIKSRIIDFNEKVNEQNKNNQKLAQIYHETASKILNLNNKFQKVSNDVKTELYKLASTQRERKILVDTFYKSYAGINIFNDIEIECANLKDFIKVATEKGINIRKELKSKIKELTKNFFIKVTNRVKDQLEKRLILDGIHGEEISISIKILVTPMQSEATTVEGYQKLKLYTFFRDSNTYAKGERPTGTNDIFSIVGNTAFERSTSHVDRKYRVFIGNNLRKLHNEGKYNNEREHFWIYYNSAIVLPIQSVRSEHSILFGFLAADCLNKKGIEIFKYDSHYSIMATATDIIASFYQIYDSCFSDLFIDVNEILN